MNQPIPKMSPEQLKAREAVVNKADIEIMDAVTRNGLTLSECLFLFSHLAAVQLSALPKIQKHRWLTMFEHHYKTQKGNRHKQGLPVAGGNAGSFKGPKDPSEAWGGDPAATLRTAEEVAEQAQREARAANNEPIDGAADASSEA